MKTVSGWLDGILEDPVNMRDWLQRQYRGEVRASIKIRELLDNETNPVNRVVLNKISQDEARHARWIRDLYIYMFIERPESDQENSSNRYWAEVDDERHTQDELYAVASHAEEMRLHRIRALVECHELNIEIRNVFSSILIDENFHAEAFKAMASVQAYEDTKERHEAGLNALGLVL